MRQLTAWIARRVYGGEHGDPERGLQRVFFILALLATLGYALQGVLMAGYYRSMDRLSASYNFV